jgi:hypothetical protein
VRFLALHQDALGLPNEVAAGQRGSQLAYRRRADEGDGGVLGEDCADVD